MPSPPSDQPDPDLLQKQSVGEIVDFWAATHADHPAIIFLNDDGQGITRSYGDLRAEALAIATQLQEVCQAGDRVILLFPPGSDFVAAFLGCLYAGVLAVPATEPKPRRLNDRLSVVAADCEPAAVVCSTDVAERIDVSVVCPSLEHLPWIRLPSARASAEGATGERAASERAASERAGSKRAAEIARSTLPAVDGQSLAFLQYTSGSTSDPKGVAISHHNLLHNLEMIRRGFRQPFNLDSDPRLRGVFWLPPYHDMGLIGGILTPLYIGGTTVLMSPVSFLKRPERWLETISEYRALISGAPNFAYDLCVEQIDKVDRESLDLSCWEIAFCGAEPIRAGTIDRFCERFEPHGFRRDAFYPCYGLAEATLLVSGNLQRQAPAIKRLNRAALENHRVEQSHSTSDAEAFPVVGCGQTVLDGEVRIVDPETRQPCPPDVIGEIWYRGENVASGGYWNQPEENERTFRARVADEDRATYLRTGDLGFVDAGQLYVTGRLKEMLVIRGRNFYPQDLEATAQASHPAFADAGTAFSIEIDGAEQLVLVQELERQSKQADPDELIHRLRASLAETHEIRPAAVVLVRAFSLPRTTSGKMQRLLCRQMYLRDQLKVVAKWVAPPSDSAPAETAAPAAAAEMVPAEADSGAGGVADSSPDATVPGDRSLTDARLNREIEELEQWLCERVAAYGNLPVEEVTPDRPLAELGLDSISAVRLVAEIEERQDLLLNPIAMWNYPTARHLARYLVEQAAGKGSTDETDDVEESQQPTFDDLLRELEGLDEEQVQQRLAALSPSRRRRR